jgi:hydroxymethylglutaryl-CoA reductase
MRALATEGIQRGHMALHARQIAMAAGAQGDDVAMIAQKMIDMQSIKPATATALLQQIHVLAS